MSECPVCQSQLRPPPAGWHADSHCSRCGGVWISAKSLKSILQNWEINARFVEHGPSADFCPTCGPVPMDEGVLLDHRGLVCGSCRGVFLRKPLREPRVDPESQVDSEPPLKQDIDDWTSGPLSGDPHSSTEEYDLGDVNVSSDPPAQISAPALLHVSHKVPTQDPPPHPRAKERETKVLVGLGDLIWFGGLAIAIIASLIYWMNP